MRSTPQASETFCTNLRVTVCTCTSSIVNSASLRNPLDSRTEERLSASPSPMPTPQYCESSEITSRAKERASWLSEGATQSPFIRIPSRHRWTAIAR